MGEVKMTAPAVPYPPVSSGSHCQPPSTTLQFRWKTFVHIWPLIFRTFKDPTDRKSQPQLLKNTNVLVLIKYVKLPHNDVSANSIFVHKKISRFSCWKTSNWTLISVLVFQLFFFFIISVWKLGNFCCFLGTALPFGCFLLGHHIEDCLQLAIIVRQVLW